MPIITTREFEVNYHDVDYRKRAFFTSLMDYFCDMSNIQSEELGVGLDYMKERNFAWVIYKWDISVKRYPVLGERITLRTIPVSSRKFYAYRRFEILDSKNNLIVVGNSIWILINLENRRPARIPSEIYKVYGIQETKGEPFEIKKIEASSSIDYEKQFNVRYSDIDTNKHVNNVKYVSWIIESIPLDIVLNYTLKQASITYEKETTYGEIIKASTKIITESGDKITCLHKIIDKEGKELTLIETSWDKQLE